LGGATDMYWTLLASVWPVADLHCSPYRML